MPLTITSYPRPFNQQLPEPPDPRCILEPHDSLDLAPTLVCALCCCFGIIYCCFGEGRALGKWGGGWGMGWLPNTVLLKSNAKCPPCSQATSPPLSDGYLRSFPYCLSQLPVILPARTLWLSPLPPVWAFPLSLTSEFHS